MNKLEELKEEYIKNDLKHSRAVVEYTEKRKSLEKQMISLASFSVGDHVKFEGQIGIVREIEINKKWREDEPAIEYRVGKITKSGKIHGIHNIHYTAIPEPELTKINKDLDI